MKQVGRQSRARDAQVKSMLMRGINAQRAGDRFGAEQAYRSVPQLDPKNPDALNMMGTLALDAGKMDAAKELFRSVVKQAPRQPQFLMNLANAQLVGDKPELAKTTVQKPIKLLNASPKPIREKYDTGFAQFAASKREDAQDFALDQHLTQFAKTKDQFSADFITAKQQSGHPSARPIFVVGMPRSGTTLTEQILASHPQISGAGELPDIRILAVELGFGAADPDIFFRNVAALTENKMR